MQIRQTKQALNLDVLEFGYCSPNHLALGIDMRAYISITAPIAPQPDTLRTVKVTRIKSGFTVEISPEDIRFLSFREGAGYTLIVFQ